MAKFCFIHAADLHLDTPFEGVGRVSPDMAALLRDASLKAWDALIDLALDRGAAFLLLAGDIYDGPVRGVRAQLRFARGLDRLHRAGAQTFIVLGNHDGGGQWLQAPPGATVFGASEVTSVPVERDGRLLATIHGLSLDDRNSRQNLAKRFTRGQAPGLHIGLLHCNVGAAREHEPCAPCALADLAQPEPNGLPPMDYWALGHVHLRQFLRQGAPWVVYPGNLQGRSPKPSELGAKGAVVVQADGPDVLSVDFVPLDAARFVAASVDIAGMTSLADLRQTLDSHASRLRAENEGRPLLARVTLTGPGPLHDELRRQGAIDALLKDLRDESADSPAPFWWERLLDHTRPLIARDRILERNDFSAELLKLGAALRQDPAAAASLLDDALAPLRRKLAEAGAPGEEPPEDLLRQAEDLALDLLQGGGQA